MPGPVRRRHWSMNRNRFTEVDGVGDCLAVDGAGDRLSELLPAHPRVSRIGRAARRQVEPQLIGIESKAGGNQSQASLVRKALETGKILWTNVGIRHHVRFPGL